MAQDGRPLEGVSDPIEEAVPDEETVDDALIGSFPASDPPFWTLGLRPEDHSAGLVASDPAASEPAAHDPAAARDRAGKA